MLPGCGDFFSLFALLLSKVSLNDFLLPVPLLIDSVWLIDWYKVSSPGWPQTHSAPVSPPIYTVLGFQSQPAAAEFSPLTSRPVFSIRRMQLRCRVQRGKQGDFVSKQRRALPPRREHVMNGWRTHTPGVILKQDGSFSRIVIRFGCLTPMERALFPTRETLVEYWYIKAHNCLLVTSRPCKCSASTQSPR